MKNFLKFHKLMMLLTLIVFVGVLTACGGAGMAPQAAYDSEMAAAPAEPMPYAEESEAVAGYADADRSAVNIAVDDSQSNSISKAQLDTRVIIYTGDMALVVKDTQEAISAITQLAAEKGGYISSSNIYQYDDVPRGSITLRVSAELYQETLASLRALAVRVEREGSNSQDVTEEYTDLQARKTNLEYTEAALQELLEERRRTGNTSDILEVYRELTNIRGQIEQIEGRLRYLTNQAALSTITIELIPDVLYQPVSVAGWEPRGVAREALQSLVAALQGFVNLGIWLVIFVLPILVILLIPVVVIVLIIRWWWKRRQAKKQVKQEPKKVEKAE
jgi:flagellar basal body-associated protein FliL